MHDFRGWSEVVPSFSFDRSLPFSQLIVPTVDTVRFSRLLAICLDAGRPVLFNGVTGVGKSVIALSALEQLRTDSNIIPYTINFSA